MTTTINELVDITLLDGTVIQARPLKISLLREFMKKFNDLEKEDVAVDNDKTMDVLVDCTAIALKQFKPELATDKKALEDVLDIKIVYAIIKEASGADLAAAMGVL